MLKSMKTFILITAVVTLASACGGKRYASNDRALHSGTWVCGPSDNKGWHCQEGNDPSQLPPRKPAAAPAAEAAGASAAEIEQPPVNGQAEPPAAEQAAPGALENEAPPAPNSMEPAANSEPSAAEEPSAVVEPSAAAVGTSSASAIEPATAAVLETSAATSAAAGTATAVPVAANADNTVVLAQADTVASDVPPTPAAQNERLVNAEIGRLPEQGYVIQLLAVREGEKAPQYLEQYPVEEALVATIDDDDGRSWHILLLGPYSAHVDAAETLHLMELPPEAPQPWIRSNEDVNKRMSAPLQRINP